MKNTIWDIKEGEAYYRCNIDGSIICLTWTDYDTDKRIRDNANAFLTEEEAKAELEARRKKVLELRPKPFLTEKEMRYLKAVIRPFRDDVDYIVKYKVASEASEFISIQVDFEHIQLPSFKIGAMYQGMERDREYALEELGL